MHSKVEGSNNIPLFYYHQLVKVKVTITISDLWEDTGTCFCIKCQKAFDFACVNTNLGANAALSKSAEKNQHSYTGMSFNA